MAGTRFFCTFKEPLGESSKVPRMMDYCSYHHASLYQVSFLLRHQVADANSYGKCALAISKRKRAVAEWNIFGGADGKRVIVDSDPSPVFKDKLLRSS